MTDAAKNTVTKLLVDVGRAAADCPDDRLRLLPCQVLEADEIWAYCYAKQKNVPEQFKGTPGYGDVWTFTVVRADTKLVPTWLVADQTRDDAVVFLCDLDERMTNRIQLSTGNRIYEATVAQAPGRTSRDADPEGLRAGPRARQIQPGRLRQDRTHPLKGDPDPSRISTGYVERQNLTMRMGMRRFTRLTNGFSKKVENLAHAVSLHFLHYNFARSHAALKDPRTPAMAAGVADHVWSLKEIAWLLD